jgi:tetratricopeptide (TPR) repeat protein
MPRETTLVARAADPPANILLAGALIAFAACVAYANTLGAPFIFDDKPGILDNPSIRHLWPLTDVLSPTPGTGTGVIGRPVVNLSLALNYAIGGTSPRSYHLVNLLVHALAGLALFGIVRRTLARPPLKTHFGRSALTLAGAIALLWTLHPLQTESVTCVIQRTESLMGLFYLGTVYFFVRGVDSPSPRRWQALAVAACGLGMATKEVMVSAPVLALLHDRTFAAGSFVEAWRRRRAVHLALFATWALLAILMLGTAQRGGTVGLGLGLEPWRYALTQCGAIVHYLRLAFWPDGLVLDYGAELAVSLSAVWPQILLLVALAAGTAIALVRRPALGFAGAWFFAILAPSSSIVPLTTQTVAEHRMYLPLAAVIAVAVLGIFFLARRSSLPVFVVAAVALGFLTWQRNELYLDEVALWSDTLAKRPDNPRAYNGVALALDKLGRHAEAAGYYERALRLKPDATVHLNYADLLQKLGRPTEAIEQLRAALRLNPAFVEAHYNLGNALFGAGRRPEAMEHYREALRLRPYFENAHYNLGCSLLAEDQPREAAEHFREFLRQRPDFAPAHHQLGNALAALGHTEEAVREDEEALRLKPDYPEARANLDRVRPPAPGPAKHP